MPTANTLDGDDRLHGTAAPAWRREIQALTDRNRERPDPATEKQLVERRAAAYAELRASLPEPGSEAPGASPHGDASVGDPVDDLFAPLESWPPEVAAADLSTDLIRSALTHHGALLVRGILDRGAADALAGDVERTVEAATRAVEDPRNAVPSPDFDPHRPASPTFDEFARGWTIKSGTIWAADAPHVFFELTEIIDRLGLASMLEEYFGEPPVVSLEKCSVRRVEPDAMGAWHQDARFLESPAVNLWMALTDCGVDAPSMDILSGPVDHIVETGLWFLDWTVHPDSVAAMARETPVRRVEFQAGDGLIFDGYLLHQTSTDRRFTRARYGTETWFFPASTFPTQKWIPLVL